MKKYKMDIMEYQKHCKKLAVTLQDNYEGLLQKDTTLVYGIVSGGLLPGIYISNSLDIPLRSLNFTVYSCGPGELKAQINQPLPTISEIHNIETVILVDSIVDTGQTIKYAHDYFESLAYLNTRRIQVILASVIAPKKSIDHSSYITSAITMPQSTWVIFPYEQ